MSLNVSLTPELEAYIAAKVAGGTYISASEVVREGLRLLQAAEDTRAAWAAAAREHIEHGWQQAARGQLTDGPTAMRRVKARMDAAITTRAKTPA